MKVLYLLNRVQKGRIEAIQQGIENDDHLYGLLRLPQQGVQADYLELEQYLPKGLAAFIRKHLLTIYWVHLPLFFTLLKYDVVFTSTAFGTQLAHALYPFKKPKWVMLDFSLIGLIGKGTTLKQKLFTYLVRRATGIVTIDADEKQRLEQRFPKLAGKIVFLRFAVDTAFFTPRDGVEETNLIFSPGRDPGRDFKTLFQAMEGLDVHAVLTAREGTLQRLQPLPPAVTNAYLTTEEYVDTFARAAVVVIPLDIRNGINNAMGTSSLVEAMAMGKAVIVTRTPTSESYVEHGRTGLLVPPHDPAALREAIATLVGDQRLRIRLGTAARAFVETECSADGFAAHLAAYLKGLA